MKYTFILFTILLTYCSTGKPAFVTNLSGTLAVSSEGEPAHTFVPFGTQIYLSSEKDKAGRYLVSGSSLRNVYVSSRDIGNSIPERLFVGSLAGLTLTDGTVLNFGDSVELTDVKKENGKSVLRIKYGEKKYNVPQDGFIKTPPEKYFYVSTMSNLNLRAGPGISFPIISTVRFGVSGPILKAIPKIENIQKANGVWFYTEIQGMRGWLFSGFAVIYEKTLEEESNDKDSIMKGVLRPSRNQYGESSPEGKTVWTKNFGRMQVSLMKKNYVSKLDRTCGMNEGFFHITGPNTDTYLNPYDFEFFSEELIEHGFLLYSGRHCGCCCAMPSNKVIALAESGLQQTWFETSETPRCFSMDGIPEKYVRDTLKISKKSSTLFLFREYPVCSEYKTEEISYKQFKMTGKKYTFNVYHNVKSNIIEEHFDVTSPDVIPSDWKAEYDSAEAVKLKYSCIRCF